MADFDDDLALLASELNRHAPVPTVDLTTAPRSMETWLSTLRDSGASDLLLIPGAPPTARSHEGLTPLSDLPVDGLEVEGLVLPLLRPTEVDAYRRGHVVEATFAVHGLGRFRVTLRHGRGRAAATIHALPSGIPTLDTLGATHDLAVLTTIGHGLLLVAGPDRADTAATVAAIVGAINHERVRHIVIVDDPMDYEHVHGRSLVEHVEVGTDTPDVATGVRAAMRQGADVIVAGDLAAPEITQAALVAAHAGALVIASLPATTLADAIEYVVAAHAEPQQPAARHAIAASLAAVVIATPITTARGRHRAFELLVVDPAHRPLLGTTTSERLRQACLAARAAGSFTRAEAFRTLVERGDATPGEVSGWLSQDADLG